MKSNDAPPYDPELLPALEGFTRVMPATITADMIPTLRERSASVGTVERLTGRGFAVEDFAVPDLPHITGSVIRGEKTSSHAPVIFYCHGGGMTMGDRFTGVDMVCDWIDGTGAIAVTVDYRLAPEHPFPAAIDDCYAALTWVQRHAGAFGGDTTRVLVAGSSAGGGIAAGVVLMSRDRGAPPLAGQLLKSPMLDDRHAGRSHDQYKDTGVWNAGSNDCGWESLLGSRRGASDLSAYAAPARATNLAGLPPTLVDVGSAELFRDESIAFANRIWSTGGVAELHVWQGGYHGFDVIAPGAKVSKAARSAQVDWINRVTA